jgi:hypothetical protein
MVMSGFGWMAAPSITDYELSVYDMSPHNQITRFEDRRNVCFRGRILRMSDRTLFYRSMLCAGICFCLATALLLWAGRRCRAPLRFRQSNPLRNCGGWRWSRWNRIPPTLNGHATEQSDQESRTGDEGNPKAQGIASHFKQK